MRVEVPSELANQLLARIQFQLERQFHIQPMMHGNTLVGHFERRPNVVGDRAGTGTIVIAFDPATRGGMSIMRVLIVPNLYLARRMSDEEGKWHQPNRDQEAQYRRRIYNSIVDAMRQTCRVIRSAQGFVCSR